MAKETQTIVWKLSCFAQFDGEVNRAIRNGWTLVNKQIVRASDNHYEHQIVAFLERETN